MKEKVLEYLKMAGRQGKTPTEIGVALGIDYYRASGKVCPVLKRLVAGGLVERQVIDGKVLYRYNRL